MALGSTPVFSPSHMPMAKKIEWYLGDLSISWVFNVIAAIEAVTVAKVKKEVRAEK